MDIIVPNQKILKDAIEQERKDSLKPQSTPMVEGKMGNLKIYTREQHLKGKGLEAPQEKIARDKIDGLITSKAEVRQTDCWVGGCPHKPHVWVREIQFDVGRIGDPINIAHVSTSDYDGPIPGLCVQHHMAEELAQAVYFSRPEMEWGYQPERAIVIFTDGSYTELSCLKIDPLQPLQIVEETYTNGNKEKGSES